MQACVYAMLIISLHNTSNTDNIALNKPSWILHQGYFLISYVLSTTKFQVMLSTPAATLLVVNKKKH